jgi:hypothetical protein
MGANAFRAIFLGLLVAVAANGAATGQTTERPPIGAFGSPADAMIFYVAHGTEGACGPGCADWIAAEGTVQWDTWKRLINILDRQNGRKLPLVIHAYGQSNLNVAVSLGRILHDRGIDATDGSTEVGACAGKPEADCFLLKRPGGPLDASLNASKSQCDLACVLILAGGVHRNLHPGTRVILTGMAIHNRLAPNVAEERRTSLTQSFDHDFRTYLREMGVDTELLDIVDQNSGLQRATEVPPSDWARLHLVTTVPK